VKVISVFMPIGGTGKSILALNLAERMRHHLGKKVLLIDLDPQRSMTLNMNVEHETDLVPAWFHQPKALKLNFQYDFVTVIDSLFISLSNNGATDKEIATHLNTWFSKIEDLFDVCIIDTNPGLTPLSKAAYMVSDSVVLPLEYSARGTNALQNLIQHLPPTYFDRIALGIPNHVMPLSSHDKKHTPLQAKILQKRISSVGLQTDLMLRKSGNSSVPVAHLATPSHFESCSKTSVMKALNQICVEVGAATGLLK
jgi:cellulose biosynthesis protein BcsQ